MCELLGLSSNVPATVNFSLPKLAEHGAVAGTYADGWGIGYYEELDVRLFKESTAAADSDWVRFIANHDLRSLLVIAHTRRATRGTRSYPNAQPFMRELAGRIHLFAHNGDLPGIFGSNAFRPERFNPIGETDSERAFCVLLDRMALIWKDREAAPTLRDKILDRVVVSRRTQGFGASEFSVLRWRSSLCPWTPAQARRYRSGGSARSRVAPETMSKRPTKLCDQRALHPWRPSTRNAVRKRSVDKRTMGTSCRRRAGCCRSWKVLRAAIGQRKSHILRVAEQGFMALE